jgi:hypothetical protein
MTLKANLLKRFKEVLYTFGTIIATIVLYTPLYNFFEKSIGPNAELSGVLTTTAIAGIYTLFLALFIDPLMSRYVNRLIVENEIIWKSKGIEVNTIDYSLSGELENSICPINIVIKCSPKKTWLFSLLRFMGFGILIYGTGNNFGFTKTNGKDSQRYRVLNNQQVFVGSFYQASKNDVGNIWDISFDIKLLDPAVQQSSIYTGFAWGTKKHKIKCKGWLMKIMNKPLTVNILRSTEK